MINAISFARIMCMLPGHANTPHQASAHSRDAHTTRGAGKQSISYGWSPLRLARHSR